MKLMSPKESKDSFVKKQSSDIVQISYMEQVLSKLQKQINTETAKFDQNLADQRKVYSEEKLALQGEIKALEGIIKAKREERAALMVPINTLKSDAEKLVKEIEIKKAKVMEREDELDILIENVQLKLDNLSERENKIINDEALLLSRKIGIDEESEIVSKGHERLNEMLSVFNSTVNSKTQELNEREIKLDIERKRVSEYINKKEREFADIEKGLADRREALERGFSELKRLTDAKALNNK